MRPPSFHTSSILLVLLSLSNLPLFQSVGGGRLAPRGDSWSNIVGYINNLRFGENADWRVKPILRSGRHR